MQKINFYLIPTKEKVDFSSTQFKEFMELLLQIKSNGDDFNILQEFYINSGIFEQSSSDTMLLFQLSKGSEYSNTDEIDLSDYHNQLLNVETNCDMDNVIINLKELIQKYQEIVSGFKDFSELFDWKKRCYPHLLFTEDSFSTNKQNPFRDPNPKLYNQSIECLNYMNNNFDSIKSKSIEDRISELNSAILDVSCTGKGSGEHIDFKKDVYIIKDGEKKNYEAPCTPHFKLIRKDSNYRIYFSWGISDIKDDAFIIVKLGGHWNNELRDRVESEIKI